MVQNANALYRKNLTQEAIKKFTADTLRKYANLQKFNISAEDKRKVIEDGADINAMLVEKRKEELRELDREYEREWEKVSALATF